MRWVAGRPHIIVSHVAVIVRSPWLRAAVSPPPGSWSAFGAFPPIDVDRLVRPSFVVLGYVIRTRSSMAATIAEIAEAANALSGLLRMHDATAPRTLGSQGLDGPCDR
jgi:hypothetical protein